MDCSRAAHLRGEDAIRTRPERLPCGQIELVRNRSRRTAVTLEDLTTDGVVLAVEAYAGSALNNDRDRERSNGACIAQANGLLVAPGAACLHHRRTGDASGPPPAFFPCHSARC